MPAAHGRPSLAAGPFNREEHNPAEGGDAEPEMLLDQADELVNRVHLRHCVLDNHPFHVVLIDIHFNGEGEAVLVHGGLDAGVQRGFKVLVVESKGRGCVHGGWQCRCRWCDLNSEWTWGV